MNLQTLLMAAPPQGEAGNPLIGLLPWILIFAVIYFFMIRPQQKKTKEQKLFRDSLGKGDKIVTIGGVHGKIVDMEETTVIMEVEGLNRLKIERSAISSENTAMAYPKDKK